MLHQIMLSKIKNEEIITFIQQGHSQLNSIKSDNVYISLMFYILN